MASRLSAWLLLLLTTFLFEFCTAISTTSASPLPPCSKKGFEQTTRVLTSGKPETVVSCPKNKWLVDGNNHVMGRSVVVKCLNESTWDKPDLKCWQGSVMDISRYSYTTHQANDSVILFCKAINPTMHFISINWKGKTYNGTKTVSVNVKLTPSDDGREVTCHQKTKSGLKETKRINILIVRYPPLIGNSTNFTAVLPLGKEGYFPFTFQANPRGFRFSLFQSPAFSVSVTKAENSTAVYKHYLLRNGDNYTVVFRFSNVSVNDLGLYLIKVRTQLDGTYIVKLTVRAAPSNIYVDATSSLHIPIHAASAGLLAIFVVVVIILAILLQKKKRQSTTKPNNQQENQQQQQHNLQVEMPLEEYCQPTSAKQYANQNPPTNPYFQVQKHSYDNVPDSSMLEPAYEEFTG